MSGVFAKAKFETPPMVCRTCGKTAKGPIQPHWLDMDIRNQETKALEECVAFCRVDCMTTWLGKQITMIDPTAVELDILQCAGQAGGEYLESIGVYDLSKLEGNQWLTFLQAVIGKYEDMKIPF